MTGGDCAVRSAGFGRAAGLRSCGGSARAAERGCGSKSHPDYGVEPVLSSGTERGKGNSYPLLTAQGRADFSPVCWMWARRPFAAPPARARVEVSSLSLSPPLTAHCLAAPKLQRRRVTCLPLLTSFNLNFLPTFWLSRQRRRSDKPMSGEHTGTGPDLNRMTSSSSRQRDLPRHLRSTERGAEGEEPEGAFRVPQSSIQRSAFSLLALCSLLPAPIASLSRKLKGCS
jgi:hypothetical protein